MSKNTNSAIDGAGYLPVPQKHEHKQMQETNKTKVENLRQLHFVFHFLT